MYHSYTVHALCEDIFQKINNLSLFFRFFFSWWSSNPCGKFCIHSTKWNRIILWWWWWLFSRQAVSDSFWPPWATAHQASLSLTTSQSLPKFISIESALPSNHIILCCPLLLLSSIFPDIRVFSNESVVHIRWPNYWSFSFNISPSKDNSGASQMVLLVRTLMPLLEI